MNKRLYKAILSTICISSYMCSSAELAPNTTITPTNNNDNYQSSEVEISQKEGDPEMVWENGKDILPAGLLEKYEDAKKADPSLSLEDFVIKNVAEDIANDKDGIRAKIKKLLTDAGYDTKRVDTVIKDSIIYTLINNPDTSVGEKADNKICNITLPPKFIDPDNPKPLEDIHKEFIKLIEDNVDANTEIFANTPEFIEELLNNLDPMDDKSLVEKLEKIKKDQEAFIIAEEKLEDKKYCNVDFSTIKNTITSISDLDKEISKSLKGSKNEIRVIFEEKEIENLEGIKNSLKDKGEFINTVNKIEFHLNEVGEISKVRNSYLEKLKSIGFNDGTKIQNTLDLFIELFKPTVLTRLNIEKANTPQKIAEVISDLVLNEIDIYNPDILEDQNKKGSLKYIKKILIDNLPSSVHTYIRTKLDKVINLNEEVKNINALNIPTKSELYRSKEEFEYVIAKSVIYIDNEAELKTLEVEVDKHVDKSTKDTLKKVITDKRNYLARYKAIDINNADFKADQKGIENIGNTCYLNTFINFISNDPRILYSALEKFNLRKGIGELKKKLDKSGELRPTQFTMFDSIGDDEIEYKDTIEKLVKIVENVRQGVEVKGDQMREFYTSLKASGWYANLGRQADAAQLYELLFASILGESPIILQSITESNGSISTNNDVSSILRINLNGNNMQDCINNYLKTTVSTGSEGIKDLKDGLIQQCDKKTNWDISSMPDSLTFQLMRFNNSNEKLNKTIEIGETIKMKGSTYELVSVCMHGGSTGGGHYEVYNKNPNTKLWNHKSDKTAFAPQDWASIKNTLAKGYMFRYLKN